MKVNCLSISIPNMGCDKNCPYCISKITGYINSNQYLFEKNMYKVKEFVKNIGCTSILLTGKGEPLMNLDCVNYCLSYFNDFPVELQTNGKILYKSFEFGVSDFIRGLSNNGLNVIAFSIDDEKDIFKYSDMFKYIKDLGIVVRVTVIVHKGLKLYSVDEWVRICKENNIDQLSFRNLTVPFNNCESEQVKDTIKWIYDNTYATYYEALKEQLIKIYKNNIIRKLSFGATIYDCHGISVTLFDYCIQENNNDDDIRSLIYMEDGHLYTSWNSKASIIF